jgi:hypothetical protein
MKEPTNVMPIFASRPLAPLRRVSRSVIFLLLLWSVLSAVGCNRQTAGPNNGPARPAGARAEGAEAEGEPVRIAQDGPFRFVLTLDPSPAQAGVSSKYTLLALGNQNGPLVGATATLTLTPKLTPKSGSAAAPVTLTLKQTHPGTYEGTATLPSPGDWEARVSAAQDGTTGTATFTLAALPAGTATP